MANHVKCLRVIDMYNCNVFVGLKHGGNLLQKIDNSSCSRTRWPEGELVFDLISNRRPMECRIDEGVDYESLNYSRQDRDDGDGASFVTGERECPESDKTTGENGLESLDNRSGSSYKLNTK